MSDIRYGKNERQTLDVFPAAGKAPAVIFIHGGFWQAHDKSEFSFVAVPLIESGVTTIVVNYSRAPGCPIAGLIREVRACCAWVYRNAETYGIDPDRVHVSGHSAGAHLAAAALFSDWAALDLPANFLKSACLVSGIFDLLPLCASQIGAGLDLDEVTAAEISPTRMTPHTVAPMLIAVGADETEAFIGQSRHMAQMAKASAMPSELHVVAGMNHYDTVLALGDRDGITVRRALDIIQQVD
ncbi:MAG: alpha/beta hydrolase [Rhodospirillales bacterium]